MDLVLCHTTADFDTLGAAVGVSCLRPGSRIVLTGGAHPSVQEFLAIWRDQYPLIERRAVAFDQVRSLTLVDAHDPDRFSSVSSWLQQAEQSGLPVYIYDHHIAHAAAADSSETQLALEKWPTAKVHIEAVGAATTLLVEALRQHEVALSTDQATVMALGIHTDTGSLTFEQATVRDAEALAWLMAQGANQQVIGEYKNPTLSDQMHALLSDALEATQIELVRGHTLGWVKLETAGFVPGLSGLAEQLFALLGLDTLLLYAKYRSNEISKAVVVGRSRTHPLTPDSAVNLQQIFEPLGGGGHAQAASLSLKGNDIEADFDQVLAAVRAQIPLPTTAQSLMSSPVRTILPSTSIDEAQRLLLRYGHAGLCVVDESGTLVGIISRRDIDITLRHGLGHAPVKGSMSGQVKRITPETSVTEIQSLMTTYDIGRLPVLAGKKLVGIVTRSDLLRQIRPLPQPASQSASGRRASDDDSLATLAAHPPSAETLLRQLKSRISEIWPALMLIADTADQKGWTVYVVGGAVRDLLLSLIPAQSAENPPLTDIDLVVDGAEAGAGVALAEAIQTSYPQVGVQIHGQFQTASLVWHATDSLTEPSAAVSAWQGAEPLLIDIATARTEFYPYPAANPEVEASTIRQDLYRRDFTINAMAIPLNRGLSGSQPGHLLDFFGGWLDLQQRQVRVLHANSLIEDPTRIFRAIRFAVRLEFSIDAQTEQFIRYAISSGVYERTQASQDKTPALQTRLKTELRYLLSADQWEAAVRQIEQLGAWACLHSSLKMSPELWRQLRRMNRWLNRFEVDPPRWLMLLELVIAQLKPALRDRIATSLDLDSRSQHRLKNLQGWEAHLLAHLPAAERPSQIYDLLRPYQRAELLLMGDRHPGTLGAKIWHYIVRLSQIPALVDGATLKRLGYTPGPQFRYILAAVYRATLDGELDTSEAAESYVLDCYPLANGLEH
ncbi:MAG: CBS domain-containing protein [Phormidesmis sp.]